MHGLDLIHMWETMTVFNKGIVICLVVMILSCIGVFVDRIVFLTRSASESLIFAKKASVLISQQDWESVVELAAKHKSSNLARLFKSVITKYLHGLDVEQGGLTAVDLARNEADRIKEVLGHELRAGMSILASVGSIAPFVGLLGTVIGIISAFQGIAATGGGGLGAVSAGISEALIETAAGLLVAIPVVLAFNYLTGRVGTVEMQLSKSASELIDELELDYGRESNTGNNKNPAPQMNVTPLIDVVLVLLIIFMVVTPAVNEGEQIELPAIFNPDAKDEKDFIAVTMAINGTILVDELKISEDKLLPKLKELHEVDEEKKLLLKLDAGYDYKKARDMFKQFQDLGFRGVLLKVVEKKKGG